MKRKIYLALAMVLTMGATAFSSINTFAVENQAIEAQATTQSLVKTTQYGAVQGAAKDNCNVCYSIPYAAAPIGDLRWAATADPTAWTGV